MSGKLSFSIAFPIQPSTYGAQAVMQTQIIPLSAINEVSWLSEAKEVRHPISPNRPLWVRESIVLTGEPLPCPTVPHPEWHPYCEFNYNFHGAATQYVGADHIERRDGDLMLIAAGTPHYAIRSSYPERSATVYFLPMLFLEMGPEGDGARFLSRFTTPQSIEDRVIRTPKSLNRKIADRFEQMISEFSTPLIGSELRLRALLMECLVDLLRWEQSAGKTIHSKQTPVDWLPLEKALRYIHGHYSEPLYIVDVASAAGMNVGRLQNLFQDALGMSWLHYLRNYRITNAAAMLCAPDPRVTEIALSVGFETLSHFNTSFRTFTNMSPTEYMRSVRKQA